MINNETIPNFLYFSIGGLDVSEPWQGRWNGGVLVECVGRKEPEPEAIIQGFVPDTKFITTRLQDNQDEDLKTLTVYLVYCPNFSIF